MSDTGDRDNQLQPSSGTSLDARSAFEMGVKLLAVIIGVTVLSIGTVACTALFIYLCFVHPDAATTLLPLLIPAGMAALVTRYGKKATELINKDDKTSQK
jgi:hypothetical protein